MNRLTFAAHIVCIAAAGKNEATFEDAVEKKESVYLIVDGHYEHPDSNGEYYFCGYENDKVKYCKDDKLKLYWNGDCWDVYDSYACSDTEVPPERGYDKNRRENDIRVEYRWMGDDEKGFEFE